MTTKHTPGPWEIYEHGLDRDFAAEEMKRGKWEAVSVFRDDENGQGYEHVAYCHPINAPLVAAAPDMASEISKQIDWLKHARSELAGVARPSLIMGFDQSIKHLTAVLAKARGEG